jgi:hypothetical protein
MDTAVATLIDECLHYIRGSWYQNQNRDTYFRDEPNLTKAIARYGYECLSRNWHFDALTIQCEILGLLTRISDQKIQIRYLPLYLEGAIDRHIRLRAEELSAQARQISRQVTKALKPLQPGDLRPVTDVEVLATLYKDLKKRRKRRAATAKQPALL